MTHISSADPMEAPPAAPLKVFDQRGLTGLNRTMWLLTGFVVGMTTLAAFTPIRSVTVGQGQVAPAGSIIDLGHAEGGLVAEVFVKPGDDVVAGQPLLRLSPGQASAELNQAQVRELSLAFTVEKLRALMENRAPNFAAIAGAPPKMVAEARAAFEAENRAAGNGLAAAEARVAQRRGDIQALAAQIQSLEAQVRVQKERYESRRTLQENGWIAPAALKDFELRIIEAEGQLAALRARRAEAASALAEAQSLYAQARASQRSEWAASLARANTELESLRAGAVGLADRVRGMQITAPASGIIQDVPAGVVGSLVRPGESMVRIVPSEGELFAEVRVSPDQIARVQAGDSARVIVTAYDTESTEKLEGEVLRVSPSTYSDGQGAPFYLATIKLPPVVRDVRGQAKPIMPGMVVRAEIVGSERSLLRTMVRPIDRALERAFRQAH